MSSFSGVLDNAWQIIKGYHSEIANSTIEFAGLWRQSDLNEKLRNVSLHGELLGGGRISFLEAIKHLLEAWQKLFGPHYFGRVGICGQRDCLANGRDWARDASSLNLFSLTIVARSEASCKTCEEADSDSEQGVL